MEQNQAGSVKLNVKLFELPKWNLLLKRVYGENRRNT